MDEAVAFVRVSHDLAAEPAVAEHEPGALAAFFAGLHQGLPGVVLEASEKQHLDLGAGVLLRAVKPRRNDLRVVDDQAVTGLQILHDVLKDPVLHRAGLLIEDHEP